MLIWIDLSKFNTSNVIDMYGLFQGCFKITSFNLDNFDTSKVENMGCVPKHGPARPRPKTAQKFCKVGTLRWYKKEEILPR